jgi:predicted metal-binding transcription factor (methanogenesis marker protein 9)
MPREEYVRMKLESVKGTPLEHGSQTCFGSLTWCCKNSSPCMFRNMTLKQYDISTKEYMRLKHELSEKIMSRVFP